MECNFQISPPVGQPGELLPIGSGYGRRNDPITGEFDSWHSGIDIPAPKFTPVRAAMDGVIQKNYFSPSGGNTLWVNHGNGVETRYMHMAYPGIYNVGEFVRAGMQIGAVGSTGERTTGDHLHFEIRVNDQAIDPTNCYLAAVTPQSSPYEIPADYTGSTFDYTAPPETTGNGFPWWMVFGGIALVGTVILVATSDQDKPKQKRKRVKRSK